MKLRITNPDGIANHTKIVDDATGMELQNTTSNLRLEIPAGGLAVADITVLATALDLVAELRSVTIQPRGDELTRLTPDEATASMVEAHRESACDMLKALNRAGIVLAKAVSQ